MRPISRQFTAHLPRFSHRPTLLWVLVWSLLVGASALLNLRIHQHDAFVNARFVADAYIDKDLAVRRWITEHGGVYVRPSEQTPPNPWLHVPNRDVVTTDGTALTLVNPAYATRQLLEGFAAQHGIRGHLTALQLKNPDNAPDPWEDSALRRLQTGDREVVDSVDEAGVPVLRLMRPVYMESGCLNCHGDLGIPLGGLRGGISTTVPLQPFIATHQAAMQKSLATHGLIWLFGLGGIGFNARRARERHDEQQRTLQLTQREDRRIAEVLSMSERLEALSELEIIQEGLETAVSVTNSRIGYFHFVNEDQNSIELVTWSKATQEHYCKVVHDSHYPLEQAGVWADCARLHQPVVHNDYAALAIKRGLPEGHAELRRHMSVPVIEGGLVRVITGVGNKDEPYDEHDVRMLQLLANDIWKLVQRKRADSELRDSARRLREAQQLARLGSWTLDHQNGQCSWSEQMYTLFGLDPLAFTPGAGSLAERFEAAERGSGAQLRHALAALPRYEGVHRVLLPSGMQRLVHLRAVTEFDTEGHPLHSVGTVQDVTEQREMETLRQSKADLSALFEHTDRMIWSVNTEGRLIVGNALFQEAMRRFVGRPISPGEVVPPPGLASHIQARWHDYLQRAFAGERVSAEVELSGADGQPRWLDFAFCPIHDEDGRVSGVTVFGRDDTERRQLEQSRQHSMDQLALTVRELESLHQRSLRINRLNDLLLSCRNEAEAYGVAATLLGEIFHGYVGCLAVTLPRSGELRRVASWGSRPPATREYFAIDDCWALRRGELHETRRPGDLTCEHFDQPPACGSVCLPLVVRGETLGLLHVEHLPGGAPAPLRDLQEVMGTVAETIKLSFSNLRLRVALEEQATHDALTGLFNRRYLDDTLPRELHRVERNGGRLAVVMMDIDHFKNFNDRMGHEAGDLVLREIGQLLLDNLRRSDIGCRYGGEELLLILPDSGAEEARGRLGEICERIRNLRIRYRNGPLPAVTVSVGIAATDTLPPDAATLLRAADEALYAAKQGGRDRIEVARGLAAEQAPGEAPRPRTEGMPR